MRRPSSMGVPAYLSQDKTVRRIDHGPLASTQAVGLHWQQASTVGWLRTLHVSQPSAVGRWLQAHLGVAFKAAVVLRRGRLPDLEPTILAILLHARGWYG